MARSLEQILAHNRFNNFNMIRLCMALGVLYNHSFVLFNDNGHQDVVKYVFNGFDAGSLSVSVFFLVSGMLLTQSYFNTQSQFKFILKRLLRIFPGLLICLLFTVFIIGSLNTALPLQQYFSEKGTIRYLYNLFLNNEVFFFELPGCFAGNKMPYVVNGSLWTLPYELICYIFLFLLLSSTSFLKSHHYSGVKKIFTLFLLLFFAIYLFNGHYLLVRIKNLATGFRVDWSQGNNPLPLFLFFFIGSLCHFLRHKIKLNLFYFSGLCALLAFMHFFHMPVLQSILEIAVIAYGTLVWAGIGSLNRYNFKTDPSYGIYLYAWPVQQTIAHYFHPSAYESLLYTVPVVLCLGWLSYVFIERPALNYANIFYDRWLKKEAVIS